MENKFKESLDVVRKTLRQDPDLYFTYQCNIAVQFQDAMINAGYKFPDLHKLSNEAAMNFLDLLIGDIYE